MITKSGAKLLDFGLAKSSSTVNPSHASSATHETEHKPLTGEGTILGTFQYMAPEQLEALEADARTDIFALGTVLYEMASGHRAFEGKTRTSLIAAIVKDEPRPLSELQPLTPPAFEHLVQKCLSKDPDDRWQSAHDVAQELRWILAAGSQAGVGAPVATTRQRRGRYLWPAASVLLVAIAAVAAFLAGRESAPRTPIRFAFLMPLERPLNPVTLAASPDGKRFAFILSDGKQNRIFLRALNGLELRPIAGTEGAMNLFFSPAGDVLVFAADGKLKRVPLDGGPVTEICDSTRLYGGVWLPDDTLVYSPWFSGPLFRVDAKGGTPKRFTTLDPSQKEAGHTWPVLMPGGDEVIFTVEHSGKPFNQATLAAQPLNGGPRRVVLRGGYRPRALDATTLLFARGSSLFAVDVRRAGEPIEVLRGIYVNSTTGAAAYSVAAKGLLAYVPGDDGTDRVELLYGDRVTGKSRPLTAQKKLFGSVAVPPDGTRLALSIAEANDDIWTLDLRRDLLSRLTFEAENFAPVWNADGTEIVFTSDRAGPFNLYAIAADGGGSPRRLTTSARDHETADVAPDGTIAFTERDQNLKGDIYLLPEGGAPHALATTPFNEVAGTFSPDGKWLAYTSDESGQDQVYIRAVHGTAKWQISTEGGYVPQWDVDGRTLFFAATEGTGIHGVRLQFDPHFSASRAFLAFPLDKTHRFGAWDVMPDGKSFVFSRIRPEIGRHEVRVVTDFANDVRARLRP
jgi:Tol biopolymer transport system component